GDMVDLVERPRARGVAGAAAETASAGNRPAPTGDATAPTGLASIRRRVSRQPGRCCDAGCDAPPPPA
ncbi:MAG: hypothetical protein QOD57_5755, partial [Actinomycetota bacterium]|nr:hypothetical protein [Actinomycetota bacterium]